MPPPRKTSPDRPASKQAAKAPAKKKEAFIGHDAKTLVDEDLSFEDLERAAMTNTAPALEREEADDEATPPPGLDDVPGEDEDEASFDSDEDEDFSGDEDEDEEAGFPEDDEEEEAPAPARKKKLGPGGRPVDRDGVEWDWVTNEGMGFNDDDDEDACTFEKNGKTYFKPDWGDWPPGDYVGYWKKIFAIESAQEKGDKAHLAAIKKYGLRNENHLRRVQETFTRHHAKDPEFTNAAVEARQGQVRGMMQDAVKPGMLDPIEGVSLQVYAGISAQRMNLDAKGFVALLKKHKLDEAKFARVDEAWQKRMSDQSDPMAAAAIATEYGKAFAGAGAGQFGASAQAASGSLGINDKVAGKNVKGKEPMSFERYVEIMTAQSCWATQGKDVNEMLQKVFKMNAVDYSNASAHWAQKMSTDVKLMTETFPALQAKYTQKYSAGVDDPDDDLEV